MGSVMQVNIVRTRRVFVCRDRIVLTMQIVVTASAVIKGVVSLRYAEMTMIAAVNSHVWRVVVCHHSSVRMQAIVPSPIFSASITSVPHRMAARATRSVAWVSAVLLACVPLSHHPSAVRTMTVGSSNNVSSVSVFLDRVAVTTMNARPAKFARVESAYQTHQFVALMMIASQARYVTQANVKLRSRSAGATMIADRVRFV